MRLRSLNDLLVAVLPTSKQKVISLSQRPKCSKKISIMHRPSWKTVPLLVEVFHFKESEAHDCVHKGPPLAASIMSQKNPVYTPLCYLKPTLISSRLSLGVQAVSFKFCNQNPLWIPRTSLRAAWPAKLILIHIPASITNGDRHYANFSKLLLIPSSSARCSRTTAAFTLPSTKGH